jgi:transposase
MGGGVFPAGLDGATLQGAIMTHVQPQSWLYADAVHLYDRLALAGFTHIRLSHDDEFADGDAHINGIENFRGFAKRRLKLYHGGFKKHLPLFIREMEFRRNHRNDPHAVDYLSRLLISGPV